MKITMVSKSLTTPEPFNADAVHLSSQMSPTRSIRWLCTLCPKKPTNISLKGVKHDIKQLYITDRNLEANHI